MISRKSNAVFIQLFLSVGFFADLCEVALTLACFDPLACGWCTLVLSCFFCTLALCFIVRDSARRLSQKGLSILWIDAHTSRGLFETLFPPNYYYNGNRSYPTAYYYYYSYEY